MSSRDTRAGAIRSATKGIRTIPLSKNPPFVEVSRAASNKFEEELEILRNDFIRNPTPSACFDLNDIEALNRELKAAGGNISHLARRLGVSRNTLYKRLRQIEG